jgi:hypothetical protein
MTEIHLTDDQIKQLAAQINLGDHKCRFDETESKTLHRFAQSLENGGWAKWQALLDFGATLLAAKKTGISIFVVTIVGAVLAAMWAGFKVLMHKP